MKIKNIAFTNEKRKKTLLTPKSTGYLAVAGVGLSALSGLSKNEFLRKNHKFFAGVSFLAIIAHIWSLHRKYNYKK